MSCLSLSKSNEENEDKFDGKGFANYLAPYVLTVIASLVVTAAPVSGLPVGPRAVAENRWRIHVSQQSAAGPFCPTTRAIDLVNVRPCDGFEHLNIRTVR